MRRWPLVLLTLSLACSKPGLQSGPAPAIAPLLAPGEGDSLLIAIHKVRPDSAAVYERFMKDQWYPAARRLADKDPIFGRAFARRWRLVSKDVGDDSLKTYFFVYPYIGPEALSTWGIYRAGGASDDEVARDSARYFTWVDHTEGYLVSRKEYEPAGGETALRTEEAAIRAQETRWREVIARKDTAAIGSFYTGDGIYAPTFRSMVGGRDAVAAMWATHEFTLDSLRLERTPIRIDVARSGDVATEIGTWVFHGQAPNRPVDGQGSYITTWRKEGGTWKISAYMWNLPDEPPPPDSTGAAR